MDTENDTATNGGTDVHTKVRTSITISPELLERARVDAKARTSHRSVSAVIEAALAQYLGA